MSLKKTLQLASEQSPVLKSTSLNVDLAKADLVTAKLRPNLQLNNQSLQLMQPSHFYSNTNWYNGKNSQIWWQLTKPFQIGGLRKNKIDFAQKELDFSLSSYQVSARELYQEIANKWLDVWQAEKQLEIIQIAKNNADSLLLVNQNRLKNQVITENDLLRSDLLAKQYKIQLKSAEQIYLNKKIDLNTSLGLSVSNDFHIIDDFPLIDSVSLDSLIASSSRYRADINMLNAQQEIASSNIKLQKSLAYPQPELGFIWNPQNTIQYFGIYATIELPFFSRNQGEIQKSLVAKNQVEMQLNYTKVKIASEIKTAFDSYNLQRQNLKSFEDLVKQSQIIFDNVKFAYFRGGTTIVDLLEAQRSWLDVQQQFFNEQLSYRQSYIQLIYATGFINQFAQP